MARLLFRLQLCPSFFLYSIASSFLMTYELIEPALTSYGGSFEFPVLGIDLPAAVLLSEVLSKASSPWILGGFASCVGLSQAISSRYAHLCATKGKSPRFIAVRIMLQAVPLSLLYCTITLLPAALVSALACKSPLDAQALEALSLQGVVVETQKPYLVYPCLFFAFYAKCMLIFVFSRSALLLVPFPSCCVSIGCLHRGCAAWVAGAGGNPPECAPGGMFPSGCARRGRIRSGCAGARQKSTGMCRVSRMFPECAARPAAGPWAARARGSWRAVYLR